MAAGKEQSKKCKQPGVGSRCHSMLLELDLGTKRVASLHEGPEASRERMASDDGGYKCWVLITCRRTSRNLPLLANGVKRRACRAKPLIDYAIGYHNGLISQYHDGQSAHILTAQHPRRTFPKHYNMVKATRGIFDHPRHFLAGI